MSTEQPKFYFNLIHTHLDDIKYLRTTATHIENDTDLYTQFATRLKCKLADYYAYTYLLPGIIFYEIDDLESSCRCFRKAYITANMYSIWGGNKLFEFLYVYLMKKQGLELDLLMPKIYKSDLVHFILRNNDFTKLPADLETDFKVLRYAKIRQFIPELQSRLVYPSVEIKIII